MIFVNGALRHKAHHRRHHRLSTQNNTALPKILFLLLTRNQKNLVYSCGTYGTRLVPQRKRGFHTGTPYATMKKHFSGVTEMSQQKGVTTYERDQYGNEVQVVLIYHSYSIVSTVVTAVVVITILAILLGSSIDNK